MTQISKVSLNQGGQDSSPAKVQSGNYLYLLKQSGTDSAAFTNKEKKEGMSMGAKIALLAAGIAAAGGAIYLAVRRGKTDDVSAAVQNVTNRNTPDFVMNGETTVVNLSNKAQKEGLTVSSNFGDEAQETVTSGQWTKTKVVDVESSDIIRQRTGDSIVSRAKEEVDGATKVYLSLKKEIDEVIAKITPEELEKIPLDANGCKMINISNKNKSYRLIYEDGEFVMATILKEGEHSKDITVHLQSGTEGFINHSRYKDAHFIDGKVSSLWIQDEVQTPWGIGSIVQSLNPPGDKFYICRKGESFTPMVTTDFKSPLSSAELRNVPAPLESPKFTME